MSDFSLSHSHLISLIIVFHDQISALHLNFLVDALNQQHSKQFNTFWIDQTADPQFLRQFLGQNAQFPWHTVHTDYPVIAGVRCWELVNAFAFLLQHPEMGKWFTYLHLECIPPPQFVKYLLEVLPEIESQYGPDTLYLLHQLWCEVHVEELHPRHYIQQLQWSNPQVWSPRVPYDLHRQQMQVAYYAYRWQEDAFLMPSELARRLQLYSAVQTPLFFQDVFDIFDWLCQRPYGKHLQWVRIQDAVIYHVLHRRPFKEYRRFFLDQLTQHPDLFGHLSLYDLALASKEYIEIDQDRFQSRPDPALGDFYYQARWAPKGTMSWWLHYLDQAHGYIPQPD